MNKITSNEIRYKWIKFFESKGHYYVPSSSLVPVNDKSLLWINSGVATLKSYFDGSETPPSPRLVNIQKAIRTGDIENVGITTRHHTFFEMMGNFSIGDYFKKEAIEFGWELLTSPEWLNIDPDILYVTVFHEDEEAIKIWKSLGLTDERIFKMNRDTNFWDMGKGPCGPSTEIFYDKGLKYDSRSAKEVIQPDLENDRYVEIWNIVFSQFNNDGKGNYKELPQKNIDTGAGLERIVSALQGKPSNFETDLFDKLISKIGSKSKYEYLYDYIPYELLKENKNQFYINSYYKKVADYIRSVSFAISDGAMPESTGRGYILRMLLRKAVINRTKLGIEENFLHELVDPLIEIMGEHYPLLIEKRDIIIKTIKSEEEQFNKTLASVVVKLNQQIKEKTLDEISAYKLHETYGLPLEYLEDLSLNNKDINLDWNKIKDLDLEFKAKSKGEDTFDAMKIQDDIFIGVGETIFIGYNDSISDSKVIFISGDKVVFDKTPFYATSGGQESDFGMAGNFNVKYVEKNSEKTFIHLIPNHNFKIGDMVHLEIDENRRKKMASNHSATHMLFSAIEKYTNSSVPQQGSKVEESFLRFDFSFQRKLEEEDLDNIQNIVNEWVRVGNDTETKIIPISKAKEMGATFLDGSKYGEVVRVVILNEHCVDMCGGTHVSNVSKIEEVLITKLEKRGSGVWRLEAVSGKDNIANAIVGINQKVKEGMLIPILNKFNLSNKKTLELNIDNIQSIEKDLSMLDEKSTKYKKEVLKLGERVQSEIININNKINSSIEEKIKQGFVNSKLQIFQSDVFNIQDISRPMLNIIDQADGDLGVIIISNKNKVTFSFILNKKNVNDSNVNNIKELTSKYNLRGNGKKQQYIFGGPMVDITKVLAEIKKWEF